MQDLTPFHGLDIYLLDQILKGRFEQQHTILDAGCGSGRNMKWFSKNGFSIVGCDLDVIRMNEGQFATGLPNNAFTQAAVENMSYPKESFDHVISCAVLHFANSEWHFLQMVKDMCRVLKNEGMLFIRMASNFGLPLNYEPLDNGRFFLQDGSERFLLTKSLLDQIKDLGLIQIEPVKTVLVEELRAMTTLVMRKG